MGITFAFNKILVRGFLYCTLLLLLLLSFSLHLCRGFDAWRLFTSLKRIYSAALAFYYRFSPSSIYMYECARVDQTYWFDSLCRTATTHRIVGTKNVLSGERESTSIDCRHSHIIQTNNYRTHPFFRRINFT